MQCITMQEEDLGHLYPSIDKSRCLDCGVCRKKCPSNISQMLRFPTNAYAAWSKDYEDYRTSTSGGIASVLSKYVIGNGGVVYGCAMLPNIEVKHIRVDKDEDLHKLKGSKYVQSSIVGIIPSLKNDIKEGRIVLFVGTPCQVAAIKSLYKTQPDNLFLVDLICHGVPSLSVLQKHIKKVAPKTSCDYIVFRSEGKYALQVFANNNLIYKCYLHSQRYKDWYLNAFFDRYILRNSCYLCKYATSNRVSDITIGDFWGLGISKPVDYMEEHNQGVSVILPITKKGAELVENISSLLYLYERDIEEAINGNDQLLYARGKTTKITVFRLIQRVLFSPYVYYALNFDRMLKLYARNYLRQMINYLKS